MALISPVYAIAVPFVILFTLPLAIFAGITTTLAFIVLMLRVLVVYLDIALALVPKSLFAFSPRYVRYQPPPPSSSAVASARTVDRTPSPVLPPSPLRRRQHHYYHHRRRPSSASAVSFEQATTPVGEAGGLGLTPSVGAERDFEGVGGWRTGGDDDQAWTMLNSRLEMPDRHHGRNHFRSASGGSAAGEGSYLMMKGLTRSPGPSMIRPPTSPNSSRARTPSGSRNGLSGTGYNDGYFPLTLSPKAVKKSTAHSVA